MSTYALSFLTLNNPRKAGIDLIHYHGTPIGGSRQDVARFLAGRHALVPFPRQDDVGIVADVERLQEVARNANRKAKTSA